MTSNLDKTMMFSGNREEPNEAQKALLKAYQALKVKGYNPIHQIVGYLISGDPAYITSHDDARNTIRKVERDDLIEELVRAYLADRA
ncbi:IreB family regulatory phosphoprotein [Effusibacillus dendaii]|uniref:UPF0297 protein skT53_12800 n=1 Tax=Effusibacillus dendaii TaxID=2743772 RepID=A0A7I8D891_9BACL|nr:IreB family regulatory phosphoprotein [Effusibacillus dendaii]BCJ86295.1 UPF0297 protein [Effusibacillus dendaii]